MPRGGGSRLLTATLVVRKKPQSSSKRTGVRVRKPRTDGMKRAPASLLGRRLDWLLKEKIDSTLRRRKSRARILAARACKRASVATRAVTAASVGEDQRCRSSHAKGRKMSCVYKQTCLRIHRKGLRGLQGTRTALTSGEG